MRIRARRRILDYVAQHPGAEAAHIARALGSTSPAVRYHLAILRAEGRVEMAAGPRRAGRGRPRLGYRASEAITGNSLAMLAEHLLAAWPAGRGQGRSESQLVPVLARMLSEHLRSAQPESPAARSLALLVDDLNHLHYRARWEAGSEGPRMIFDHCPYAAVVDRHPELCRMDARSIGAIMHADVQQKAKIDPSGRGARSCVFMLKYR